MSSTAGLTLGFARANLPTQALSPAVAASASQSARDINAAIAWVFQNDKWLGSMQEAVFTIYDNEQITLPRDIRTIEASVLQGTGDQFRQWVPMNVASEWYQWIPGGGGFVSNPPWNTSALTSLGEGFVFFRELPSTGHIKIYNVTTESAGTINIRGYDSTGAKVYTGVGAARIEGENVAQPTTAATSVTTSTTWGSGNSVYAIIKPTTNGILKFYHVAADLTETLIGSYEPGETNPNYRRYLVPRYCISNDNRQVVGRCKRNQVDVVVDNDQIIPGNLQALEMALMALYFRRKADIQLATQYLSMAVDQLNQEVEEFNAEQSWPTLQIQPVLAMSNAWDNVV